MVSNINEILMDIGLQVIYDTFRSFPDLRNDIAKRFTEIIEKQKNLTVKKVLETLEEEKTYMFTSNPEFELCDPTRDGQKRLVL